MKKSLRRCCFFVVIAISICTFVCCSNQSKTENDAKKGIGKYVYIDSRGVLHSRKCYLGMHLTNAEGMDITLSINFLDTASITSKHLKQLCPMCVEDSEYEVLKRIVENNEIIDYIPNDKGRGY